MWKKSIALAIAFAALAYSMPTSAQALCNSRATLLTKLDEQYSESPSAIGLASNGSLLEVLTSDKGSWTIIVTAPNGTTCMVASGNSWELLPILDKDPAA